MPTCTRHYFKHYSWELKLRNTVKNIHVHLLLFSSSEATPPAHQMALSCTMSQGLLNFMSIEFMMLSNSLIFCGPLLLWPFPASRSFPMGGLLFPSSSQTIQISHSKEYSGLISFRIDLFNILAVQGTLKWLFQYHSLEASIFQC